MTKKTISVGDRVLKCVKWVPNLKKESSSGRGVVTLIADSGEDRMIRVLWTDGECKWHCESELVNVKNIKSGDTVGSRGSD